MSYLLDTHAWVWMNAQPGALSEQVRTLLADPEPKGELLLSAISVWEVSKLVAAGRLMLAMDLEAWVERALDVPGLRLAPLSPRVAMHAATLPGPSRLDPADQIIVATARLENATVVTRDRRIREYAHVASVW